MRKRCLRREEQEHYKLKKNKVSPEVINVCLMLYLASVFSILANILVVGVLSMPWNIIWLIV